MERIAIVEFDNQSANAAASPIGAIIARIVALQLAGAPNIFVYPVASAAEAPLRRATRLLTGYLTSRGAGGPWTLHAQIRVGSANRALRTFVVTGADAAALADAISAQLGQPGFSASKIGLTDLEAAMKGSGNPALLGELARLRLTPAPSELVARAATLRQISELSPADSETAFGAAAFLMQVRQVEPAAQAYRRALRADPDWPTLCNEGAFGLAFAGDMSGALAAIESYRKLEPRSANPSDSQGEILSAVRRYDEAERAFLAAFDKDPAFYGGAPLRKAAEVRRASGNQAEADRLFERYSGLAAKNSPIDLLKAQWDYSSGRSQQALVSLEAFAVKSNASAAWTQLAAWRAATGKHDAPASAQFAFKTAKSGADQQAAVIALFATQPAASATEWQARAGKQFPPAAAALARQALIYALVLGKHWREAIPFIAAERDALTPATASFWQALLARAFAETGDREKAKAESRFAPIPRTIGDATWDFLIYPAQNDRQPAGPVARN